MIPRAGRPVSTFVSAVWRAASPFSAAPWIALIVASGQSRYAVPSCTPTAPSAMAAATPRASAMPPAAMTGNFTARTICGSSANVPICVVRSSDRNMPRWPPGRRPAKPAASATPRRPSARDPDSARPREPRCRQRFCRNSPGPASRPGTRPVQRPARCRRSSRCAAPWLAAHASRLLFPAPQDRPAPIGSQPTPRTPPLGRGPAL